MANATVSRLGQADGAGDALALFLKVFGGEVLTAFETELVLRDVTRLRAITSGKSASFPATFQASAAYHTPGVELVGTAIKHNEVIVSIDDLLVADVFIAEIDEAMNHYDVRAPYSTELGRALARIYDANIARNLIRSARLADDYLFTGDDGGAVLTNAAYATTATTLASGLWAAKQEMEEKDVPVDTQGTFAAMKPAPWYLLAQEPTLILNRDVDGDGSYSQGSFSLIGGISVLKSNNLPWVDDSANAAIPTDYRINMATTVAAVFTPDGAATVQLLGLAMESARDPRRQGTLMIGKYAVGHAPLRGKCSVELKTA
jgi:hypothetical protein